MGKLSRDVVFSIMNESTLVIVPSYSESFGLVALEAMQMERAVIASSVGGLPEVVSDGKTGLLVPPQDVQALYLAIESLLANSSRAIEMGKEGRKRAIEMFTIDRNVSQYEDLYIQMGVSQ